MSRTKNLISRRELIKQFGITAFLLSPLLRSMGAMAAVDFNKSPRYLQIFKGGGCLPTNYLPASMSNLSGLVVEPLQSLSQDLVLFKNLTMSNGYRDEDGGRGDEHGGGTAVCFTGGRIHCWKKQGFDGQDSYGWESWDISADQKIAEYYKTVPGMATPFDSLVIGLGLSRQAGPQIYVSFKQGAAGQQGLANAITPIGDPAALYTKIFDRLLTICGSGSNQPVTTNTEKLQILNRRKSIVDFQLSSVKSAKNKFGMDSEHSHKLDGMLAALADTEKQINADIAATQSGGGGGGSSSKPCPSMTRPGTLSSSDLESLSLDVLNSRFDQFNQLIKIAFEWDLTRVVSYVTATGSNEQTYSGGGAPNSHHSYAHANSVSALFSHDKFHFQKVANLLSSLKEITDPDGKSALYNTTMIMGMDTWGSQHSRVNMPFVLAGQGGGRIQTGRIVDAQGRNQNDLLITALNACGIQTNVFGKAQYCQGSLL